MTRLHADGAECRCAPVGRCISCSSGNHDRCWDLIMILGCGCECAGVLSSRLPAEEG